MAVSAWRRAQFNIRSDLKRSLSRSSPTVCSVERTCHDVHEQQLSLSRFGDGEINLMRGRSIRFQEAHPELRRRLHEVASSHEDGHTVALPDIFESLTYLTPGAEQYWKGWRRKNWEFVFESFPRRYSQYGNSFISRFYIDWKDKEGAAQRYELVRNLWQGQSVLIVEGSATGFGRGNDVLSGASSIQRIVCPAANAFSRYEEVKDAAKQHSEGRLVLIALGPTATVLAYDLHLAGRRAIDIGHLDIEYEWLRMAALEKVELPGKASAEAATHSPRPKSTVPNVCGPDGFERQVIQTIE